MDTDNQSNDKKKHRERNSGRKAEKKKNKKPNQNDELTDKQRNPKAFAFNSAIRAERRFRRKQDIETKKQHVPVVDRTPIEPPPLLVAIVGPPKVGKSTLINNLIKLFTRSPLTEVKGPVTIVTGKKRRVTLIECNNDINSMIDIAKVADLVLLLCDASFGFEMEMFEFLNICQVHGMPRIMGVLTHLDMITNSKTLKSTKKILKHRFWTEVYAGAKLFYLSGIVHGEYLRNEIKNLGRFISVMKLRPLMWRTTHSYLLADRMEDLTSRDEIRKNPKCDRTVSIYGYVRGIPLNSTPNAPVHIPGLGDLHISEISNLPDPCAPPGSEAKKRALVDKEKLVYAPFSGVGGIVYDKDAVYVELGGSHSMKSEKNLDEPAELVSQLIDAQQTIDMKMESSKMQIFSDGMKLTSKDFKESKIKGEKSVVVNDQFGDIVDSDLEDELNQLKNLNKKDEIGDEKSKNENTLGQLKYEIVNKDERVRRKVIFDLDDDEFAKNLPNDEEQDDDDSNNDDDIEDKNGVMSNYTTLKENKDKNVFNIVSDTLKYLEKKEKKSEEKHNKNKSKEEKVLMEDTSDDESEVEDSDEENDLESENSDSDDTDYEANESHLKKNILLKSKKDDGSDNESDTSEDELEMSENKKDSKSKNKTESIDELSDESSSNIKKTDSESSGSDSENSESEDFKWKENLAAKARDAFISRQSTTQNLMKLVYGVFDKHKLKTDDDESNEQEEIGNLFHVVSVEQKRKKEEKEKLNIQESSLFETWKQSTRDWTDPDNKVLIENCFVTGKWKQSEDATELLRLDDMQVDTDEEIYGDFEDLETGEKHTATNKNDDTNKSDHPSDDKKRKRSDEDLTREELAEKKRKLKEKFDAEYDTGDKSTYYDELKSNAQKQAELNKQVFEDMPDDVRVQIEGYRSGMYVRIEFEKVPAEFVTHFDAAYPLIVGALNMGEENIGFVNIKIKKHRWYRRILKTNDPLIISLGWRRFQTVPLFSKLEDDLKYRYLKYTPEHVQCNAQVWGPITPQGTGLLAIEPLNDGIDPNRKQGFRIVATGSVQESDKSTNIMKKLKLIGYPYKIYKKTAFIKDMFTSSLEVAKFEGARIKTVSGIRGQVKKAVSKPEGCFRATFEDKIQLSDIVFCRTWYKVDVPKFYCPVNTLLLPPEKRGGWTGAKTAGQLRREAGIQREINSDSLYTEVVRKPRPFKPLAIPRKLQKELPYRDKPKHAPLRYDRKPNVEKKRVAVVREPHEQKISNMLKMLRTSYQDKQEKLHEQMLERMARHKAQVEAEQNTKDRKLKLKKKEVFRMKSKAQAKEQSGRKRKR